MFDVNFNLTYIIIISILVHTLLIELLCNFDDYKMTSTLPSKVIV